MDGMFQRTISKALSLAAVAALTLTALFALPLSASAAGSGSSAGTVSVTSGTLNVRSGASAGSAVVASLAKGSTVTLLSRSGTWWYVEYAGGRYGYASAGYITPVSGSYAAYVNVGTGYLNVRSGGGTGYGIVTSLPKNTGVVVLSQSNGWSRILYYGVKTGYVSSTYLKAYGTAGTGTTAQTYPAIALSVPSYKQTDSRWSATRLGTTGSTIATVGCLTTAVAMTESYRTGTTIYPNAMAARLTYSASGTMYWPGNYVISTDASYLAGIYARLKERKPVVVGFKNTYGSQHWVVVTGYVGGSSLTASGFTVNDPGSSSRTNLQQLISAYPTYYKMAYYV